MSNAKHLVCVMHLDWNDQHCPCGAEISTRFMSTEEVTKWRDEHRPHTSGKMLVTVSDNGARAFGGERPADELVDF